MTTRAVIVKAAARADIRDNVRFIARDSVQYAEKFGNEFDRAIERIAAFPEAGAKVSGFRDLRSVRVSARFWRHLIIYRVDDSEIRIVRVLHGAMDAYRHLSASDRT